MEPVLDRFPDLRRGPVCSCNALSRQSDITTRRFVCEQLGCILRADDAISTTSLVCTQKDAFTIIVHVYPLTKRHSQLHVWRSANHF